MALHRVIIERAKHGYYWHFAGRDEDIAFAANLAELRQSAKSAARLLAPQELYFEDESGSPALSFVIRHHSRFAREKPKLKIKSEAPKFHRKALTIEELWWPPAPAQSAAGLPIALRVIYMVKDKLRLSFCLIPAGEAPLGTSSHQEESEHSVRLSKSLFLQATPVTQRQWFNVVGSKPWNFREAGPDSPVEGVTWFDACEYCNKVSELEELPRSYMLDQVERDARGSIVSAKVGIRWEGAGYRLPTEAEWEYACRAGSRQELPLLPSDSGRAMSLGEIAWFADNSSLSNQPKTGSSSIGRTMNGAEGHPQIVGTKAPNAFGLYDMIGNVEEWCWDRYGAYPRELATDPTGPADGSQRIVRGGSWQSLPGQCRASARSRQDPATRSPTIGFRVCRWAPRPKAKS